MDKDFDDLLGKVYQQANVFYLDRYCIENFLLEENAIIKYIIDERPRLKAGSVRRELQFQMAWDGIVKQLSTPFAMFFVVQKYNIAALQHTSHKPDVFCALADKCKVDKQKVSDYAKQVKKKAATQGISIDMIKELDACSAIFELNQQAQLKGTNVSGEFILCLLAHRITKIFALDHLADLKSLAFRLAQECNLSSLCTLQKRVNSYLNAC